MTTEEQEQTQGKAKWTRKILDWIFNALALLFCGVFVVSLPVVVVVVADDNPDWIYPFLGIPSENPDPSHKYEALKSLGLVMGGILFVLQVWASHKRAQAMEDTAKAQARATDATEQGQRQERLRNAIEHLGHESSVSMRLGGAYELVHLAKDTEALRKTALDILCAHIRRTTGEDEYQAKYQTKPSEEVQSLLTLLFVQDHQVFKDLQVNLQGSFLNGADLNKAHLPGAVLRGAHLLGAVLRGAHLPGAVLRGAHLPGADLVGAHLPRADLRRAHLPGANLRRAHLPGAVLRGAHLPRADLSSAHLRGAGLSNAHLPRADLSGAQLQGAGLVGAHLPGADLSGAQLQGAGLMWAQLQGAGLSGAHLPGANLSGAHLQGADLSGAYLQGAGLNWACLQVADLRGAQLQGANLRGAQLQGADLRGAQLQAAALSGTDLRGVGGLWIPEQFFAERMDEVIGKESDLSEVVFEGGLSREDVDSWVNDLSDEKANELRIKLEPHVGRPEIWGDLPENCGAKLGAFSKEEAEQWIAEYNKAMSEPPEEPEEP